jgi:hypothetical protein
MQDRPTREELIDAVRGFLETEIIPALDGTLKFHARVAANVLAIVSRELALEGEQLDAEWRRLDALLGSAPRPAGLGEAKEDLVARNAELCRRIREAGPGDESARRGWLDHVRETVREKLAVANPKMLDAAE